MVKDINEELNKLLSIKEELIHINNIMMECKDMIFIFKHTYDTLPEQVLDRSLVFYIIPYEVSGYIEEDIILLENNKIFVLRNGNSICTIEL